MLYTPCDFYYVVIMSFCGIIWKELGVHIFDCEGFAIGFRTSWVRTLIDWTKKGRISLISIEHRLGS